MSQDIERRDAYVSFKVTKLTVGKGRTRGNEKEGWTKTFYQMEAEIEDEHCIEIAKASLEGLIDGWLTPSELTSQTQAQTEPTTYDPNKIKWEPKTGASEEVVNCGKPLRQKM